MTFLPLRLGQGDRRGCGLLCKYVTCRFPGTTIFDPTQLLPDQLMATTSLSTSADFVLLFGGEVEVLGAGSAYIFLAPSHIYDIIRRVLR